MADPVAFAAEGQPPRLIDEVHLGGDWLVRAIKIAVDEDPRPGRFILSGSSRFLTVPTLSESLAGRAAFVDLWPLSMAEVTGGPADFLSRVFSEPAACAARSRRGRGASTSGPSAWAATRRSAGCGRRSRGAPGMTATSPRSSTGTSATSPRSERSARSPGCSAWSRRAPGHRWWWRTSRARPTLTAQRSATTSPTWTRYSSRPRCCPGRRTLTPGCRRRPRCSSPTPAWPPICWAHRRRTCAG